ncbi:MAG: phytochrome-like protein cph2, partial [Actinobacteria bacterium]|nr:phytochrome-like protein cph2 [Actinomycetota bacterium]
GYWFGRPAPLPSVGDVPAVERPIQFVGGPMTPAGSAFAIVKAVGTPRRTTKRLLAPMSRHLEDYAYRSAEPPVLLSCFQTAEHFPPSMVKRYADLAGWCSFVAALGAGIPQSPAPHVRGAHIPLDDQLAGEWIVAVIGPHFAAAIVARDAGDRGPELDRGFDYVLTHDRELVVEVGRCIMQRVSPQG